MLINYNYYFEIGIFISSIYPQHQCKTIALILGLEAAIHCDIGRSYYGDLCNINVKVVRNTFINITIIQESHN
jgi:hypothetical protein